MNDFRIYLFEYSHEGKSWTLPIKAKSESDALDRIQRLQSATLLGIQVMEIPIGGGWFARLICRLQNLWRGR